MKPSKAKSWVVGAALTALAAAPWGPPGAVAASPQGAPKQAVRFGVPADRLDPAAHVEEAITERGA